MTRRKVSARDLALAFAATLIVATPAMANPMPLIDGRWFPASLLVILVFGLCTWLGGCRPVLSSTKYVGWLTGPLPESALLTLLVLTLQPLGVLATLLFVVIRGSKMIGWADQAKASAERPECLATVRPRRMQVAGFTLLAAVPGSFVIVTLLFGGPNSYSRTPVARAVSEVRSADLAFAKILSDTGTRDLHDLFADPGTLQKASFEETLKAHTVACYDLLLHGRNAAGLKDEFRPKMSEAYMDIRKDPWKHEYQFFLGPLKGAVNALSFRCYRGENYVYDRAAYEKEERLLPGYPKPEADSPPGKGLPCAMDIPVYIFSMGQNGKPEQLPFGGDGGDDVNNWDSNQGWAELYQ